VLAYRAAVKEIGDVVAVLVVVAAAMSLVTVAKDCIDDSRSNVSQLSVSVAATAALWVAGEGACCIRRGSQG
jgi:hypothetical protein